MQASPGSDVFFLPLVNDLYGVWNFDYPSLWILFDPAICFYGFLVLCFFSMFYSAEDSEY